MMGRQQLHLRPTVHGMPAGTTAKMTETSAETAKQGMPP